MQDQPRSDESRKDEPRKEERAAEEQKDAAQQSHEGAATADLSLEQALEQLDVARAAELEQKNEVLRLHAEMQNLRRRTELDVEKAHKYGQERLVGELLPVIDNLERALKAVESPDDPLVKALCDGVELTLKSFLDCFRKFSIEQIDPEGEPFDPQLHQAMGMLENPDVEPDTVVAVMQKGYTLNNRVIRPAMVMVSRGPSPDIDEKA